MAPLPLCVTLNENYAALNALGDCLTPMTPGSGDDYAFFRSFVAAQAASDPELAAALAQLEQQQPADMPGQDKQCNGIPAGSNPHETVAAGKLLIRATNTNSSLLGSQHDGLTSSVDAVVRVNGTDSLHNTNRQQQAAEAKHHNAADATSAGLAPAVDLVDPNAASATPKPGNPGVTKLPLASRSSRNALIRPDFTQRQIKSLRRIFPIQSPLVKSAAALQGEYQLLDMVGSGAFGTAYKARHLVSGNLVCIKTVEGAAGQGLADVERQKREVAVLAALKHPNIIRYHDCFSDGAKLHIVMEWAEGGDLKGFISRQAKAGTRLSEDQVLTYFVQIVSALAHIHAAGVMHRDIKTSNILFSGIGFLKLADFGIAKVLEAQGTSSSSSGSRISSSNGTASALVTAGAQSGPMAQSFVGTPNYLAPEMINCEPYNQKADIWAIGCLLYEMAALRPAFKADRIPLVYRLIRRGRTAPLPACYGAGLRGLLQRLMASDPNDRPSSAQLLQEDLLRPYCERYQQQLQQLGLELPPLPNPVGGESVSGSIGCSTVSSSNGGYSSTAVSISGVVTAVQQQQQQQQQTKTNSLSAPAAAVGIAAVDHQSKDVDPEVSNIGQATAADQQSQQQQQQGHVQPSVKCCAAGVGKAFMPRISLLSITGSGGMFTPITVAPESPRGLNSVGSNRSSAYNTERTSSKGDPGFVQLQQFTASSSARLLGAEQGTPFAAANIRSSIDLIRRKQRHRMSNASAAGLAGFTAGGGVQGIVELLPLSHAGGGLAPRPRIRRLTHHSVTGHLSNRHSCSGGSSSSKKQRKDGFKARLHRCLRKVFKNMYGSSSSGNRSSGNGMRYSSSGGYHRAHRRRSLMSSVAGAAADNDDGESCYVITPAENLLISTKQHADAASAAALDPGAAAANSSSVSSFTGISSSNNSSCAGCSLFGSIMGDIRRGLPALRSCVAAPSPQPQQEEKDVLPQQLQFRLQNPGRDIQKMLRTVIGVQESKRAALHNNSSGPYAVAATGSVGGGFTGATVLPGDSSNTPNSQTDGSLARQPASTTAQAGAVAASCESSRSPRLEQADEPAEAAVNNKLAAAVEGMPQQEQSSMLSTLPQKQLHQHSPSEPQAAATAGTGPQQQSRKAASHQLPASKPAGGSRRQADAAAAVTVIGPPAAATKLHREQRAMLLKIQELRASLSLSPSPVAGNWGCGSDDADE